MLYIILKSSLIIKNYLGDFWACCLSQKFPIITRDGFDLPVYFIALKIS